MNPSLAMTLSFRISRWCLPTLVLLVVFFRNVVLGNLSRSHFALIRVRSVLDAADNFGLEVLPLFGELFDALGIHIFLPRQSLVIAGLAASAGPKAAAAERKHPGIYFAGSSRGSCATAAS